MNRQSNLIGQVSRVSILLLIMLWSYAFFIKLADFNLYRVQMQDQPFPTVFNTILIYTLFPVEGLTALLLILNKQIAGLWLSILLLLVFTWYILIITLHYFPDTPCSCGGFISKMSWKNHLWFNLGLIAINGFCLSVQLQKRKEVKRQSIP